MKVKYIGPLPAIEILGRTVKHGQQFEVTDAEAGHPPSARYLELQGKDLPAAVNNHGLRKQLEAELVEEDLGEGLLAQVDNFQPVTAGKPPKEGDK